MFFFDLFMNFIYEHPLFRKLLMYLIYTVVGFFIAVIGILYVDTGELIFDRHILFSSEIYAALLDNHRNAIYMMIVLEQFVFISVLMWQNHRLKNRSNCSVKYVHIEDIASIWLQNQRIKENIKKEYDAEAKKEYTAQEKKPPLYVNFKKQRSNDLFNNIVMPHIDRLLDEEVDIIIELLRLVEDKGQDTPSVVSFTEKDPETKYKKDVLTEDGLTSYQILRKVSLYDHTLNVVNSIYEELKRHSKTNYVLLLGKAIIAALAHDMGKIKKMEERLENVSPEIFSSQPHHQISKIFFMKMYPNYRDRKIVIEAIENHHSIKVPSGNDLIKLLITADKGARDFEIDEYFKSDGKQEKLISKREKKQVSLNDKEKAPVTIEAQAVKEETKDSDNENKVLKDQLAKVLVENRLLEDKASKCHLTRAFTRATYDQEVAKFFEENKETLALAFIDADKFKSINDNYGHHTGDEVLKHMVNTMFDTVKEKDGRVYRYGGEEFLILFPKIQKEELEVQLEELRAAIEESTLNIDDKEIKYTISIGAGLAKDCNSVAELAKKADEAVYKAKEQGRNRVIFANADIQKKQAAPEDSEPQQQVKQKRGLNDKIDIDIADGFDDMFAEKEAKKQANPKKATVQAAPEKVVEKPKKEPAPKKPQQQKMDFEDEKDYETDEAFNIEEYENEILELLKEKINISRSLGYETIFDSISYKDMVLFNFNTVVTAVEKAIGFKGNSRELAMHFIRTYRKNGDIGYIDIDNNYTTSKFYIEENGNTIEYDAVPIFARVFNMNENDLFQLKLSDEHTKDARVLTSSEVEK